MTTPEALINTIDNCSPAVKQTLMWHITPPHIRTRHAPLSNQYLRTLFTQEPNLAEKVSKCLKKIQQTLPEERLLQCEAFSLNVFGPLDYANF